MQRLPVRYDGKKALEVYRLYHRRSLESNAVDFGGLLLSVAALLKVLVKLEKRCRVVGVICL